EAVAEVLEQLEPVIERLSLFADEPVQDSVRPGKRGGKPGRKPRFLGRSVGDGLRSGRALEQALLALVVVAGQPLAGRAHAHARGLGRLRERPAPLLDSLDDQQPAVQTGARVAVQLHPVTSLGLVGVIPPASKEARMEQRAWDFTPRGSRPLLCTGRA